MTPTTSQPAIATQIECPHCHKINAKTAAKDKQKCKFCDKYFDPITGASKPQKRLKYGNTKVTLGSITFDSKAEGRRYAQLKADPDVKEIEVHPTFEIFPAVRKCLNCKEVFKAQITKCPHCSRKLLTYPAIRYIADFKVYYKDGRIEVEDVKGVETDVFKMKRKLFEAAYPHLTIKVVMMR